MTPARPPSTPPALQAECLSPSGTENTPTPTGLEETYFDLQTGPGGRFDLPAPIQLETRGVIRHIPAILPGSEPEASQPEFWTAQTQHKNSVAAKLREGGRPDLAATLEDCHSRFTVSVCGACHRVARFPNRCDLFCCPECQPRLARERRNSVEWWSREIHQPKHVVLTMTNTHDLTAGHVQELKHCFSKLRHRKFASNWAGGFYGLEVTNEGRGWHLHLHALVDAKWIDAGQLAVQWASVTSGFGKIVRVKDCRKADYMAEVTKYAVKGSQLAKWSPAQVVEFVNAFEGIRTFGVFGSLFGKRTEFAEWLKTLRDKKPLCPCGCSQLSYFTEVEWFLKQHLPGHQAQPRAPAPEPHSELVLGDARCHVL